MVVDYFIKLFSLIVLIT